jgi:uncharacterized membrane protein
MTSLGDLAGGDVYDIALGASYDGSVIVGAGNYFTQRQAFRWTQATGMTGLGFLASNNPFSRANSVTSDGKIVVGYGGNNAGHTEAFSWNESGGGMTGLGFLPGGGYYSEARAVSGDGSIIVGRSDTASGDAAFIWDASHGMRNLKDIMVNEFGLDLTGWTLDWAYGVSDDGSVITGTGFNPAGYSEGWVLTTPEPATLSLLALGGLALLRRRMKAGKTLLVLIAVCAFLPSVATAAWIEWPVSAGGNGHSYGAVLVGSPGISWADANSAAIASGGYLATITSAEENAFVYSLFADNSSYWHAYNNIPTNNTFGPWLGGYQLAGASSPSTGWQWVTGEGWGFTSWQPGEPNDYAGYAEDRLLFFAGLGVRNPNWNDVSEQSPWMATPYAYIAERTPEPATLSLLALGGLALLRRRKR